MMMESGSSGESESIRNDLNEKKNDPLPSPSTSTGSTGGSGGSGGATSTPSSPSSDDATDDGAFECNICLDQAKDPVISMCGHLFCWPCLHTWLETRPQRQVCPVCKAGISKDKVVPLYGRNSTNKQDPREKLPPRPPGQRSEPENNAGFPGFSMGNGFHVSFGIGAFPFGIFAQTFNFNDGRPPAPEPGSPQHEEEVFMSKLFLWIAVIFFIWLLIA